VSKKYSYKSLLEGEKDLEPNILEEKDLRNILIGYYPDKEFLKHYIELINEISVEEVIRVLNNRKTQIVKEQD